MLMNSEQPALADVRVRQALMYAIDRDQIVEQAQGGLGETAGGPFGSAYRYAYAEATDCRTLYPFDPERARALLAEAGVSDLTLRFVYDLARGSFAAAAEIIRDNLRQVGITLDVQPVERAVMVERVYGRDYDLLRPGDGDPGRRRADHADPRRALHRGVERQARGPARAARPARRARVRLVPSVSRARSAGGPARAR
jgi:ABC-type transport system substrate-binding protein